jgi:hypothetical protein
MPWYSRRGKHSSFMDAISGSLYVMGGVATNAGPKSQGFAATRQSDATRAMAMGDRARSGRGLLSEEDVLDRTLYGKGHPSPHPPPAPGPGPAPAPLRDVFRYELQNKTWTYMPRMELSMPVQDAGVVYLPANVTMSAVVLIGGRTLSTVVAPAVPKAYIAPNVTTLTGFDNSSARRWSQDDTTTPGSHYQKHHGRKLLRNPSTLIAGPSASGAAAAVASLPMIPGVNKLGTGIDLLTSTPFGTTGKPMDPGVKEPIFEMGHTAQQNTFEQKWKVPDGVSARPDAHCSYDATTAVIHDTVDLAAHYLQKRVKKFCVLFFCFKKTKEYQQVAEMTEKGELVLTKSKAACNAFTASLDLPSSNQSSLTNSFVSAVGRLPTTLPTDTGPLLDFVSSFGTHFLSRVNLGGTAVETSVFARSSFSKFEAAWGDKGIAKGAALSYMKSFEGKIDKAQRYYDAYMQFVGNRTSSSRTWVPSQPPSGAEVTDSALAWLSDVNKYPAVIGHEVQNISDVLSVQYFPADKTIAAKQAVLEKYLFDGLYCKDLNQGVACTAPPRANRWLRTGPGKLSAMPNKRARTGAALIHGDEIIIPG